MKGEGEKKGGGVCVCEGGGRKGGRREGRGGKGEEVRNTCTVFRWRMAQLLMAFIAAVAMVRVECGRGRGEKECRGGPSCNSIA